jgi:MFS family permease
VSRSFNVWWKNVVRFTLLTLFAWVPLAVAGVAAAIVAGVSGSEGGAEASERLLLSVAPFLVIGGIATFVLFLAQFAGVTWGTLQLLAGRPAGFGAMLGAGFKRFGAVLAVGFVGTAAVLAGMLLLIVPGVLLGIGMAVVYPVVVSEQVGPIDAIKRSMALTKGHRGTVFGALMVVGLAAGGVNMGSNLLTTVLGSMAAPLAIVGVLLTLLIQLAMTSLSNVVCAVAYHDLRVAKEGVDTSQLAKVFE